MKTPLPSLLSNALNRKPMRARWMKAVVSILLYSHLSMPAFSQIDPSALISSDVFGGSSALGSAGIGNMNGGLGAMRETSIKGADPVQPPNLKLSAPSASNSINNAFQDYVLQVTGQRLQLFGSDFFESTKPMEGKPTEAGPSSNFLPSSLTPPSADYEVGTGDQLMIRGWGTAEINYLAVIDSSGSINLPKVGAITLAGVKVSALKDVVSRAVAKYFNNVEISVTLIQTRSITVYVVGQSKKPGTYTLPGPSTITTALLVSGGPNANGSFRRVLLKRRGQTLSEFDLYEFLKNGQTDLDKRLLDGDVLVIQPSHGYVALTGRLNQPAVYEIKSKNETLEDLLTLDGSLPVTTNPLSASLERLDPSQVSPRSVIDLELTRNGLKTPLQAGDVVRFFDIMPVFANAVTLRGAVFQPKRLPWKEGMRVNDIVPSREALMSRESVRSQNETLLTSNARERTLRQREKIPPDLLRDIAQDQQLLGSLSKGTLNLTPSPSDYDPLGPGSSINPTSWDALRQQREMRILGQQPLPTSDPIRSLADQVGQGFDEINFDYAVIERISRKDQSVSLLSFNLGAAIESPNSLDNLSLEPGDVITVFTLNDIRVPISKRRVIVRVEGEVRYPGIYQARHGDTVSSLVARAGGLTPDAYLFGAAFYRDEVKKMQQQNLEKIIKKTQSESASNVAQAVSAAPSTDPAALQASAMAAKQSQLQAIARLKSLKPEGRIALGLDPSLSSTISQLPPLKLQNNDRLYIPSRPDFVYVYGSVNTESALIFKLGLNVDGYLELAGVSSSADKNAVVLLRADGSALTNTSFWGSRVRTTEVLPGDTIWLPDKSLGNSVFSSIFSTAKDVTQVFFQLGLGAAAIKTLRN